MMDCPDAMRKGGSFATQFRCSRLHRTYSLVYLGSLSATGTRKRSAEQRQGQSNIYVRSPFLEYARIGPNLHSYSGGY